MMRRTPLHIARVSDHTPAQVEVLRTSEIAYGFLEVAAELWRLAGDAARARAIEAVVTSAYELEPPRLDQPRIVALQRLLDDLDIALVGTVTDGAHMLSPEKVAELRGKVTTLEVHGEFGADPHYAVQSALLCVDHLRDLLDEATASHACILFD